MIDASPWRGRACLRYQADQRSGNHALDLVLADIAAYQHEQALQSLKTPR